MSNHAARRRRALKARTVAVCAVSTTEHPCTRPVQYAVTFGFDPCGHYTPPTGICHPHAYLLQRQPRDPDLQACPNCKTLGHMAVVQITAALDRP